MSANGLEVFDKTIHTTNIWLNEIMEALGPDRQHAWKVLTVVLHRLRNRLPVDLSAHLGSQLPVMVRGIYYDQYQPWTQPGDCNSLEAFTAEVAEWLADTRPTDPREAVRTVFAVLSRHLPEGQIEKVQGALPRDIRQSWIDAADPLRGSAGGGGERPQPGL